MVSTIVDEMIVIMGRHAPLACRHRIGSRRVLVCARRGDTSVESSLQQSVSRCRVRSNPVVPIPTKFSGKTQEK
jgi:hypothetical protein